MPRPPAIMLAHWVRARCACEEEESHEVKNASRAGSNSKPADLRSGTEARTSPAIRPSKATAFGISIKQHEAVLCAEIDLEHLLLELAPAYWTIEEEL